MEERAVSQQYMMLSVFSYSQSLCVTVTQAHSTTVTSMSVASRRSKIISPCFFWYICVRGETNSLKANKGVQYSFLTLIMHPHSLIFTIHLLFLKKNLKRQSEMYSIFTLLYIEFHHCRESSLFVLLDQYLYQPQIYITYENCYATEDEQ